MQDVATPLDPWAVAQRLGTSRRYVYDLVKLRKIPFHKVGRLLRFDPADVEAYLRAHRVEANGDAA